MKKVIGTKEIDVNEEGYLTDFTQWDKEIGKCLADECEIAMTEKHWEVIDYIHAKAY